MPRGKAAGTGKWNFTVKRYLCTNCGKKGLYKTTQTAGFKSGRTECYQCMYCKITVTNRDTLIL